VRPSHFGIDSSAYAAELSGARRERFSEGKSGAFLYFSESGRFIVKTTTRAEAHALVQLLPAYHRYDTAMSSCVLLAALQAALR
jgi:1-phosphatidylinositol-4-phosphate 5-kinase